MKQFSVQSDDDHYIIKNVLIQPTTIIKTPVQNFSKDHIFEEAVVQEWEKVEVDDYPNYHPFLDA